MKPKKFKVKITSSAKDSYWYSDKIGECLKVIEDKAIDDVYFLADDIYKLINKSDCEIVG